MRRIALCLLVVLAAAAADAANIVLYDGALGTMPASQGWVYMTNPLEAPTVSQSFGSGATTLNTSASAAKQCGYFSEFPVLGKHPSMPSTLDRATGWRVDFTLAMADETHVFTDRNADGVSDRGGWSIIALSSDKKGIEIAFWETEVFAYDRVDVGGGVMDFVHAEGTSGFAPPSLLTAYGLVIAGNDYILTAGGTPILTGALRDYSGEGFPYTTSSFLFLGDDTGSASSTTSLSYVAIETAVPEPATLALVGLGALALLRRRPR